MNKYIAILLLAFSGSAFGEIFLCVTEAAASVRSSQKSNSYTTPDVDASGVRFVFEKNVSVKRFNKTDAWLPCSDNICMLTEPGLYSGVFIMDDQLKFHTSWVLGPAENPEYIIIAGSCTLIVK